MNSRTVLQRMNVGARGSRISAPMLVRDMLSNELQLFNDGTLRPGLFDEDPKEDSARSTLTWRYFYWVSNDPGYHSPMAVSAFSCILGISVACLPPKNGSPTHSSSRL